MAKQSGPQKATVARVMHEFKHGKLKRQGDGAPVRSPKQAIAIALHEAGATNQESPAKNRRNLRRTKAKESRGETAQVETEGKAAQDRTMNSARRDDAARHEDSGQTKKALYDRARRQHIAGRSKMSKAELARALR